MKIPDKMEVGKTKSNVEADAPLADSRQICPHSPQRATGNRLAFNPHDDCLLMRRRRRFRRSAWT